MTLPTPSASGRRQRSTAATHHVPGPHDGCAARTPAAWLLLALTAFAVACGSKDPASPPVEMEQVLDPTSLSASAPDGEPGVPTELVVQARDTQGRPFLGDIPGLAMEVRGQNPATVTGATNNGDGTYTLAYTPTDLGFDTLVATLDGVTLAGTPTESRVRILWVAASGTPTVDGVVSPGEWDDAKEYAVFGGPTLTGSKARFMVDGSNLYVLVTYPDSLDGVGVRFDNTLDLVLSGDDVIAGSGSLFFDQFLTADGLENDDVVNGETASTANPGGSVVELSHPLDSGDPQDFDLSSATRVGVCLDGPVGGAAIDIAAPGGCITLAYGQTKYAELRLH